MESFIITHYHKAMSYFDKYAKSLALSRGSLTLHFRIHPSWAISISEIKNPEIKLKT